MACTFCQPVGQAVLALEEAVEAGQLGAWRVLAGQCVAQAPERPFARTLALGLQCFDALFQRPDGQPMKGQCGSDQHAA